ncbi:MAG: Mpo1-like protein [Rubrivivax sp.]
MPNTDTPPERFSSFAAFYPYYLGEHRNPTCRRLHFVGTTLSLVCLGMLVTTGGWGWLIGALACGYGFAWVGHFFFEKNRPATFKYPLYSLLGDHVMYKDIWTGRLRF